MGSIIFNAGFALEKTDKGYKYKDIFMPIKKDSNDRDLDQSLDLDAIRNGIQNLFNWHPGERVLLPEFGIDLKRWLYEPINEITAKNITLSIKNAFELWEPRVKILNVTVTPLPDDNQYNVEISYDIPALVTKTLGFNTLLSRKY